MASKPKTGRGQIRKMLTGDGRKNLTFDEFIGAPKKGPKPVGA